MNRPRPQPVLGVTAHRVKRLLRRQGVLGASVTGTTSAAVVLTFDDGPDPEQTPRILEALGSHGATATFFVLMSRVERHPDLLHAIVRAGHEVALHGPDHQALPDFGYAEAVRRTIRARVELEAAAGTNVRWYRPPYGAQTPASWLAVRRAGLVPVLWNGTTWDWKDVSVHDRLAVSERAGRPGAIVLAHDGIAGAGDGVPETPGALEDRAGLAEWVLDRYAAKGLAVCSLGDALRSASAVRTMQFTSLRGPSRGDDGAVRN